ncbi:MAG: tetratricopeptide repeat protein, partial [Planctomycetota bacterium]
MAQASSFWLRLAAATFIAASPIVSFAQEGQPDPEAPDASADEPTDAELIELASVELHLPVAERASQHLNTLERLRPKRSFDPRLLSLLSMSYVARAEATGEPKSLARALELARTAANRNPNIALVHSALGQALLANARRNRLTDNDRGELLAQADQAFDEAVRRDRSNRAWVDLWFKGVVSMERGSIDESLERLEAAQTANPIRWEPLMTRARLREAAGETLKAGELYEKAADRAKRSEDLIRKVSIEERLSGAADELTTFQLGDRVIALEQSDRAKRHALRAAGAAQLRLDQPQKAEALLRAALDGAREPDAKAQTALAAVLLQQGRDQEAGALLDPLGDEASPRALAIRAEAYRRQGRPEAEELADQALSLDATLAQAHQTLAEILRSENKRPEATLAHARAASNLGGFDPRFCETLLTLAKEKELESVTAARDRKAATRAEALAKGQEPVLAARLAAARYALTRHWNETARRELAVAEGMDGTDSIVQYHLQRCEVALRQGDKEAALQFAKSAQELLPNQVETWVLLSRAHHARGEEKQARATAVRAASLAPRDARARRALAAATGRAGAAKVSAESAEAAKSLAAADTAARKRLVASLIRQNDVGALLLHLPQETDGAVLADLINYLGGLGSEEARISIQAKASQLEPKQHAAQRAALEVLDRLANPESIPALADIAVITTSPEIKDRATKALSDRQQG